MKSWIAKVRCPGHAPFWFGTVVADGRTDAKVQLRRFMAAHLPLDTQLLGVAVGHIAVDVELSTYQEDPDAQS